MDQSFINDCVVMRKSCTKLNVALIDTYNPG